MVIPLVEIASILCNTSQSNPKGAAHARSGNSFRGGVSRRFTRRPKGQSTVEYVLVIAIIVLVILIAGPWVSSAIGNQFNTVAGAIGSGTTGENFYEPEDIPDPENGTAFAVYSEDDQSLMFYKRRGVPKVRDMFNYRRVTEVYTGFETQFYAYTVASDSSNTPWADHLLDVTTARVVDEGIRPISLRAWFALMENMTTCDVSKLDTSGTQSVWDMFYNCRSIHFLDLSSFDTSGMNIGCAFHNCVSLKTVDLSGWAASSSTRFDHMFCDCRSLVNIKGDIECWDVSNVNNFSYMFWHCENLNLDCSDWDVSRVSKFENFSRDAPGVIEPHWVSESTK